MKFFTQISNSTKFLGFYIIGLLLLARLAFIFQPALQRPIIWGGGVFLVLFILLPQIGKIKLLPKEYFFYGSLLVFAVLGFYQIIDWGAFLRYYQVLLSNFILMIAIFFAIKNQEDWEFTWRILLITIVILSLFGFWFQWDDISSEHFRFSGILGNSNGAATYARVGILSSLVILQQRKSRLYNLFIFAIIAFLAYIIIVSASRGNFANLILIMILFLLRKTNAFRSLVLVLVLFLIGNELLSIILDSFQDTYVYERINRNESYEEALENERRLELYIQAFMMTTQNPFFGLGLNQFQYYADGHISHTDVLDIASQLGVFAAVFYTLIYVRLFKKLVKQFRVSVDLKKEMLFILFIVFFSEVAFGLTNPNWFLQLDMIVLSLIITYAYKISPAVPYKNEINN